jgi:hypothetical protein
MLISCRKRGDNNLGLYQINPNMFTFDCICSNVVIKTELTVQKNAKAFKKPRTGKDYYTIFIESVICKNT